MDRGAAPRNSAGPVVSRDNAVAVISAYGAFRLLVALLALWSFVEGFALITGGFDALSLGGHDRTAEQIIGAQMIVLVPVYALLAWQRDRYRPLIWVPYGAQLAIALPTGWSLVHANSDGALLFVVSVVFFTLFFYFWWNSHPLDFFRRDDPIDEDDDAGEEVDPDEDQESDEPPAGDRSRRYRRSNR